MAALRVARHVPRDVAEGRDSGIDRAMGIRDDGVIAALGVLDHRLGIAHHESGVPAAADIGEQYVVSALRVTKQHRLVIAEDREPRIELGDVAVTVSLPPETSLAAGNPRSPYTVSI